MPCSQCGGNCGTMCQFGLQVNTLHPEYIHNISMSTTEKEQLNAQLLKTPIELIDGAKTTFITKDSGNRETHSTGAVRDDRTGKGRYDLLSPLTMHRVAQLFERGANKYKARNWESGMPLSRYFDSGARHAFNYLEGKRDEDHLAAAVWNFGAMIHTEEMLKRGLFPKEFADMPSYQTIDQRIDLGDGFRL